MRALALGENAGHKNVRAEHGLCRRVATCLLERQRGSNRSAMEWAKLYCVYDGDLHGDFSAVGIRMLRGCLKDKDDRFWRSG